MGWRLKLRRRPDPELTDDELSYLKQLIDAAIERYEQQMLRPVSESIIRRRIYAESIRDKLKQVIES